MNMPAEDALHQSVEIAVGQPPEDSGEALADQSLVVRADLVVRPVAR